MTATIVVVLRETDHRFLGAFESMASAISSVWLSYQAFSKAPVLTKISYADNKVDCPDGLTLTLHTVPLHTEATHL